MLRAVYDATDGHDGFVSLEVDAATWPTTPRARSSRPASTGSCVDRPNVMIKIPGTDEGLPAIEQMIYEGLNINVTLLFAVEAVRRGLPRRSSRGLERRHAEGQSLDVHSVASFFVSRVDTEVDKRLDEARRAATCAGTRRASPTRAPPTGRFKEIFEGERFAALRAAGAPVQRPLWASTGVKNPAYPDTLYVDGLDRARDRQHDADGDAPGRRRSAARSPGETAAIDPQPTTSTRSRRPASTSTTSPTSCWTTASRRSSSRWASCWPASSPSARRSSSSRPPAFESSIPDELRGGDRAAHRARGLATTSRARIWRKDDTLWGAARRTPEVANRLGWLTIAERDVATSSPTCARSRTTSSADGVTDCRAARHGRLVAGARGAAALVRRPRRPPAPARARLDRRRRDRRGRSRRSTSTTTLFVVSSKSGGTIETLQPLRALPGARPADGGRFVAVTDPGSRARSSSPPSTASAARSSTTPTSAAATARCRTSGSCPAALMGADIEALLDVRQRRRARLPGLRHAVAEHRAVARPARSASSRCAGRDKLTFVVDEPLGELRPVGRAARRRVDRQAGPRDPAGRRRAARRRRRLRRRPRLRPRPRRARRPTRRSRRTSRRSRRPASR